MHSPDVMATLFCVFGWLAGPSMNTSEFPTSPRGGFFFDQSGNSHVDVPTAVIIWLYSIFVTVIIAIVYFLLNKITFLNDLGRAKRSRADTHMENVIGHLSRLAVEHDVDEKTGSKRYFLASKASEAEVDE